MKDVNDLKQNGIDVDRALSLLGDMTTYNTILMEFEKNYDERMKRLEDAKNKKDYNAYGIEAHSLKSDAKYLGFMTLADLSYQQELAGKSSDEGSILQNYDTLVQEATKIIKIVRDYLNGADGEEEIETLEPLKQAILVADDSTIITSFLDEIFHDKYEVLQAHDGKEVLNFVEKRGNDIIALLLDLNMPNINGFEVLDYFKEHDLFRQIPVSVISGSDDKESINKAFTYPIVDMITKPFEKDRIELVVEKTIQLKEVTV